jgi:hypothetical protein
MKFDLRHYLAVASHFPRFSYRWWLALLHDGIEDGWLSHRLLPRQLKRDIQQLSRADHGIKGAYALYIARLSFSGDNVVAVKIADLTENLKRCPPSLIPRYNRALEALQTKTE